MSGHQAVLALAIAVFLGAWSSMVTAQPAASGPLSARSSSGQFIVYGGRSFPLPPEMSELATNRDYVQLEPTLATVSCERIKEMLLRELGSTASWRGNIYLVLYPARGAADTITVTSERFKDGWRYRVDFPDVLERSRYVRVLVRVLLLEIANRTAQGRMAEVPLWLIEGLSQMLLASNEIEIILPPPRGRANGLSVSTTVLNERRHSLLEQVQKKLRGRPPLTFEDLSWPNGDELSGDTGDLYSGSAQLFVGELLRLPDGRDCLRTMLAQLSQHYNWQMAFLRAFHAYFDRPLDVEKWWALSVAEATGHSLAQTWMLEESWQKLDGAVHAAVQVRTDADQLPMHADASLQTIIREWDTARQTQALNNALLELTLLRLRIAQEFVGLVQDYCQTIETYLQERDHTRSFFTTKNAVRRRAAEAAIRQLDALDARREALRPAPKPAAGSQAPALPAPVP